MDEPKAGGRVKVARKKGTKPARYTVGYFSASTGKYVRYVIGSREQAEQVARDVQRRAFEAKHGRSAPVAMTLGEFSALQLRRGAAKRSLAHDEDRWRPILAWLGEGSAVAAIRPADVDGLRAHLLETRAPATVNRYLALLSSAMSIAVENGVIASSPVRRGHKLREQARDRIASPEEIERLLAGARPDLRLAIVLACETVLRRGSLAALTWETIDLDRREMSLPTSKSGDPIRVPLSRRAAAALSAVRRATGPVIAVHPDTISGWFTDLARKTGIPDLRFHDLRHTAATRLIDAGVPWPIVQALGGWRSVSAMRRYIGVRVPSMRDALDRID